MAVSQGQARGPPSPVSNAGLREHALFDSLASGPHLARVTGKKASSSLPTVRIQAAFLLQEDSVRTINNGLESIYTVFQGGRSKANS